MTFSTASFKMHALIDEVIKNIGPMTKRLSLWLLGSLLIVLLAACNLTTPDNLPTPIPTPDLPRVEIIDPPNNVQVYENTEFNFDIVARDETQGISWLVLLVDGAEINQARPQDAETVEVFRVTMNWRTSELGNHAVEAIAYRADGTQSDPAVLNVEVIARP